MPAPMQPAMLNIELDAETESRHSDSDRDSVGSRCNIGQHEDDIDENRYNILSLNSFASSERQSFIPESTMYPDEMPCIDEVSSHGSSDFDEVHQSFASSENRHVPYMLDRSLPRVYCRSSNVSSLR